MLHIKVISKRS